MCIIIGGHYKTETVGVKNLGKLLEKKFKVKSFFIDAPTGM
jgi:putative NIF3 family GTP cyclohydrolase 1 type 2